MSKFKKQEGNILLLALLIMAGMVTAGIGMGTLTLNELRQSKNVDNSVIAFYYSEAGIEQGLFLIRKLDKTLAESEIIEFDSGGSFDRLYSDTADNILTKLKQNRSLTVDLYNPEGGIWPSDVESIRFSWDDDCGGASKIELTFFDWTPWAGVIDPSAEPSDIEKPVYVYSEAEDPVINTSFSPNRAYEVRLKALYCDVHNLMFEAFDNDNPNDPLFCPTPADCLVQIPNRVTINSTGSFGRTLQNIEVAVPTKSPISSLYDYVIFSEESLVK